MSMPTRERPHHVDKQVGVRHKVGGGAMEFQQFVQHVTPGLTPQVRLMGSQHFIKQLFHPAERPLESRHPQQNFWSPLEEIDRQQHVRKGNDVLQVFERGSSDRYDGDLFRGDALDEIKTRYGLAQTPEQFAFRNGHGVGHLLQDDVARVPVPLCSPQTEMIRPVQSQQYFGRPQVPSHI